MLARRFGTDRVFQEPRDQESLSLLQEHVPGRYRMHDLIRLHAGERAVQSIPAGTRATALWRLTTTSSPPVSAAG